MRPISRCHERLHRHRDSVCRADRANGLRGDVDENRLSPWLPVPGAGSDSPNLTIQDAVFARKLLRDVQEQIKGVRETSVRYIMWHTEGIFHGLLEEFYNAILHLVQSQEGFLRIHQIGDFARVSLDLIDVYLRKGDPSKAKTPIEGAAKEIAGFPDSMLGEFRTEAFVSPTFWGRLQRDRIQTSPY